MSGNFFTMKDDAQTIRKEFRRTAEARYIHRLHAVLVVLKGLSTVAAGKLLGDPQPSISRWVTQFRKHGPTSLRDREKPGRPSALNPIQMKSFALALRKAPSAAGLEGKAWTGVLVCIFLKKRFGVRLTIRHSRRLLKSFQNRTRS